MREEIADPTIRNIRRQSIEGEGPSHWIRERFNELIHLEMLISNTLLIHSHSSHRKNAVFGREPSSVQLVVWDHVPENKAECCCQATIDEEDDFPRSYCCTSSLDSSVNAIGHKTAENLTESVTQVRDNCPASREEENCKQLTITPGVRG